MLIFSPRGIARKSDNDAHLIYKRKPTLHILSLLGPHAAHIVTHTHVHLHVNINIPYSLKLSGTKIFVGFVVFQAPTKILSLKISYKLANPEAVYTSRWRTEHTIN